MTDPQSSLFPKRIIVFIALLAIVLGVAVSVVLNQPPQRPELSEATFLFPAARPMPEFQLQTHRGEPFTEASLKGKWSFLFFGFSHCPDVCPTTLHLMSQAIRQLGEQASQTQFVFVTVDPERDSVARLAEYIPFFNPNIVGLTGEPQRVARFAAEMGVPYIKVEDPEFPTDYQMEHSAKVLLVNPDAGFHALISPPFSVDALIDDWRKMAAYDRALKP